MKSKQIQFMDYAENLRYTLKNARRREYFLYVVVSTLSITIMYMATHQIVTLVPYGINEKVQVALNYVSPNYLGFLGMADAATYFNYDPTNIKQQSDRFLERVYPKIYGDAQVKLLNRLKEVQKNNLSQIFYPEKYFINKSHNTLVLQGRVVKIIVDKVVSSENIFLELSYQFVNGFPYIKEWKYHV